MKGIYGKLIAYFKEVSPDLVMHLASLFLSDHSSNNIGDLVNSNILLGTQILEAMTKSNTNKIINTSTSWQHYNDESYNPVNLYAATKQAFEDILKFYTEAREISAINLTIFDSYGANDIRNKVINKLYDISKTKEILDMSYGEQLIDLIYIKDIINAYLISIDMLEEDKLDGKMVKYYLNSDNPMKLREAVQVFEKVNNTKLNINWGKRSYREREVMNTYSLGERLPNWYPKYTLEAGLQEIKGILEENASEKISFN